MQKTQNLLKGLTNAKTRSFVILFAAIILIGIAFAFLQNKQNPSDIFSKEGSQTISVPSEIKAVPGSAASEQYRQLTEQANERRAQEALEKKTSAIPTIIGAIAETTPASQNHSLTPNDSLDPTLGGKAGSFTPPLGEAEEAGFQGLAGPFAPSALDRQRAEQEARIKEQRERIEKMRQEKELAKQREVEQERQRKASEVAEKAYAESVKKIEENMKKYALEMYAEWKQIPTQQYVQGELATKPPAMLTAHTAAEQHTTPTPSAKPAKGTPPSLRESKRKLLVKAGTILFAVLDTSINTDEPGPILATVVSGKYQGAKVLGSLSHEAQQEAVTLTFNLIALPKSPASKSINAVAIDPDTARTALASDVDHHYLLRYGMLLASNFLSGYGQAIMQSGSTTTTSPLTGASTTSTPPLDNSQIIKAAFGQAGIALAGVTKQYFNLPYTVTVKQGTGMGLLFLADADLTESE